MRRIEEKTSATAQMTCSLRAISFHEKEACLKSDDYIASLLLPKPISVLIKAQPIRRLFQRLMAPAGVYEYVVARTKYIDAKLRDLLADGLEQVVLLGAGFDSRAIRFHHERPETVFFELDAKITQAAKTNQLNKRKIEKPASLEFIPIDFDKESMAEKLKAHGFRAGRKTLFILEGLTMYLEAEAVQDTFAIMRALSAPHGMAVFDFIYASVLRRENNLYGEKQVYDRVNRFGEVWRFGLEKHAVDDFAKEAGQRLLELKTAGDLERDYGFGPRRINGTHGIALIEIK
jgi:methyltransferase (TIGR00027 family)